MTETSAPEPSAWLVGVDKWVCLDGDAARDYQAMGREVVPLYTLDTAREILAGERGWQPIETAPKDGTRILVIGDNDGGRMVPGVAEARWLEEPEHRNQGWLAYFGDPRFDPGCYIEPTHWMPLPAPPPAAFVRQGGREP